MKFSAAEYDNIIEFIPIRLNTSWIEYDTIKRAGLSREV